jgi:hypothetical protein
MRDISRPTDHARYIYSGSGRLVDGGENLFLLHRRSDVLDPMPLHTDVTTSPGGVPMLLTPAEKPAFHRDGRATTLWTLSH